VKSQIQLNNKCIIPNIKGKDKQTVISEMVDYLYTNDKLGQETLSRDSIIQHLMDREAELTTGIGEGFAFPHARLKGLDGVYFSIGISQEGVEFASLDHKPVYFVVMTLVDRTNPNALLKVRAAIMRFLMSGNVKEKLLNNPTETEIEKILASSNLEIDLEVTAQDIMSPQIGSISPTLSIKDAARELHRHHVDSLPIIDDNKKFLGELTCLDLFRYGLPDFFNSLHVISFVKHMNPFEKYFQVDDSMTVQELLKTKTDTKAPTIESNATLMEIIFAMTVDKHEQLYVVEQGTLRGILDRYSIIDKILVES